MPSSFPARAPRPSGWAGPSPRPRRPPPPSSLRPTPPSANRSATLAWDGPADRLDLTENAQPAILATSIAILAALRERWAAEGLAAAGAVVRAGHSMGQYSALVAAGALDLADGVRLVRERGRLMQASGQGRDGAMAALIGLDDARLPELVDAASQHGVFVVANRNAPGQVVVSGERPAIEAGAELAKSLGAKRAIVLPVSVAAHSPLMAEAADGMREALDRDRRSATRTSPLLANADGRPIETAEACRAELVEHLTAGVDWIRVVERMAAAGVTTFVEIGPGRVLTGLIKRIVPDAEVIAGRRSGLARPTPRPRQRARLTRQRRRRGNTLRKPDYDRRVVVTGLGVISSVGNDVETAWANLVNGVSGLGPITRFDTTPYEAKLGGEVHDFDATDWMDAKAARRSESSMHFGVAAGQAGARRFGLRDHRREPDRGRRRSSARAPAARR